MEFHSKNKTLPHNQLMGDENNDTAPPSPTHRHFSYSQTFTPKTTSSSPISNRSKLPTILAPPSPNSPWTLSLVRTPVSHSLLYHCIASLHRHEGNIYSVAVSKGIIFTGSDSKKIRAWHQPDCIELGYIKASYGEVRAILSYGNMLFTSHKDNRIRLWNFKASDNFMLKKVATIPKSGSPFDFLTRPITAGGNDHHFHHRRQQQAKHKDVVTCMAYNHTEGLLYTGSWDKTVKAWRVSENRCIATFSPHEDHVNAIFINQQDGCVFTCSSDGCVKIWRRVQFTQLVTSHSLILTLKFQSSPINALAISSTANTTFLYSGSSNGLINFWEKEKMSSRYNHGGLLQGHQFAVLCLVSLDKFVISGSEDTTIRVWSREGDSCFHECVAVLDGHKGPVRCLSACLDEEEKINELRFFVYSASLDRSFKVWRVMVKEHARNADHYGSNPSLRNYEMSPVLSPSWVEKKLQLGD